MKVKRIPIAQLVDFAQSAAADPQRYRIMPISTTRAQAQVQNPAASPEDVVLLVAYDDQDRCVGYLGILPCWLSRTDQRRKVYALSTFFVDAILRGQGVAKAIMSEAITLDYDFLLAGYTVSAERFYRRHPEWFKFAGALPYVRIHLHPSASLLWRLRQRLPAARRMLNALFALNRRLLDLGLFSFFDPRLRPLACRQHRRTLAKPTMQVRFPAQKNHQAGLPASPHFHRPEEIINWMIRCPWIIESPGFMDEYEFSHRRSLFRVLPFDLLDSGNGEHVGYAVLSISMRKDLKFLKILDWWVEEEDRMASVLDLALREAFRWKADILEGSSQFLPLIQSHPLLRRLTQERARGNFIHLSSQDTAFGDDWPQLQFDYCDGDMSFT